MRVLVFLIALTCVNAEQIITRDFISKNCNNPERFSPRCIVVQGKNDEITTSGLESIWTEGSTYNFAATTFTAALSSSDNGDDQIIKIEGLDSDRAMQSVTAALNGQTTVSVSGEWIRVNSMKNISTGEDAFSGTVYLAMDGETTWSSGVPQTTTAVVQTAVTTAQASLNASFSTAANQYAYLFDARITSNNSNGAECWLFVRGMDGTFVSVADTFVTNQSNFMVDSYRVPRVIGPESDIDIRCVSLSGNRRISVIYGLYTELR